MMQKYKITTIKQDRVYFTDDKKQEHSDCLYSIMDSEAIHFFSLEDQALIAEESVNDGFYAAKTRSGDRRLVSLRRERYLPIFVCIFSMALIATNYTSLRIIHIGDIRLPGSFLFFPLVFACTDIINELYGYARVKRVIYSGVAGMLLIAILMQLNLYFSGTMYNLDGESDTHFRELLQHVPIVLVAQAISLLVADSCNAYIFQKIKNYMRGKVLWLRALASTFISQIIVSPVNDLLLYWFGPKNLFFGSKGLFDDLMAEVIFYLSNHSAKILYAVATLPLVYCAVHYVESKDRDLTIKEEPLTKHNS